ncbi:MAG: S-layer homology domain-containing protein [Caryophanon sp.]|nr:S-layer homology domain-containing protein [Caryophanon sp.]
MGVLKKVTQAAVFAGAMFTTSMTANAIMEFDDVPRTTQFYEPITWAGSAELINGYGDGTFKPKAVLTEAHFALMMARFIDRNTLNTTKGNERDVAYNMLKTYGISLAGQTNKKAQAATFTRLQVAKAFYTYVEGKTPTDQQAIDWMYVHNISKGKGVSKNKYIEFGGNDPLKREHMAQFFKNLYTNWYFDKHVLKKSFTESELFADDSILLEPVVADFNGDGIDEMLIKYDTIPDDPESPGWKDALFAYRYFALYRFNNDTNKWEYTDGDFLFTVGDDNWYRKEIVSMTGDQAEQLLMYSGAYRRLTIAAVTAKDLYDVKVSSTPLFAHENASWEIIDNKLVIDSSYSYSGLYAFEQGKLVAKSLTQLPKIEEPANTLNIQYSIREDGTVKSSYYNGETIYAKVGQVLDFDQGEYDWYEKPVSIMTSHSDVMGDEEGLYNTFVRPGVVEYQIVPQEDWDNNWDKALTIYIHVTY